MSVPPSHRHTGGYPYTEDLLALDRCHAPGFNLPSHRFADVVTPLRWDRWLAALHGHPDKRFITYIVEGIKSGFRLGFQYGSVTCRSSRGNAPSARQCHHKISEFVAAECAAGRMLGPFEPLLVPMVHTSKIGAVSKSTPGQYRLIVDLSSPSGHSVNDGIATNRCSLTYVSVQEAAQRVLRLGRGALLAKVDIRSAYRNLPVHPDDRWLLGLRWEGGIFIDTVLPFGLRSAPKIFNSVADTLEWVVQTAGVENVCHYLDDFLVMGALGSTQCDEGLSVLLRTLEWLGFPVAVEKLEGPSTRLTFLGIEIDTEEMVLRLPARKLEALQSLVSQWMGRRWCVKSELQSLAGKLQHATTVVRPGRSFLRRVFQLLRGTHSSHHHIRINRAFRSDLAWWHMFLASWNGVSLLRPERLRVANTHFYSDASGGFGCGAVWAQQWLQFRWPPSYSDVSITPKEFIPIVMACMVWGRSWQGKVVHVHCDNAAAVAVLNAGYSRDEHLMHLVRCLSFIIAVWDISLVAYHIPGALNCVADAISRDNLSLLFSKVPGVSPQPTRVPPPLVEILVTERPDWTSPSWRRLFGSCLQQV